jgi:hypothetical protein
MQYIIIITISDNYTRYNTMWSTLSSAGQSVVFCDNSGFLHQWNWYNSNIVKSGAKQHNHIPIVKSYNTTHYWISSGIYNQLFHSSIWIRQNITPIKIKSEIHGQATYIHLLKMPLVQGVPGFSDVNIFVTMFTK